MSEGISSNAMCIRSHISIVCDILIHRFSLLRLQSGRFSRFSYDLLFGLTEIESYNAINAIGIMHGLLENERDGYLKFYVQNRFDVRPDIAMDLTLREYSNIYTNPKKAVPEEHRDVVLEVLSDAGTAAPLFQTGVYHSRASNPSTYMYLFSHISKAGDYPNVSVCHCRCGARRCPLCCDDECQMGATA